MAYPISTSMEDVARFFSGSVPSNRPGGDSNQLYILSQKTHSEETISRNGIPKHIHLVIKNSPFNITIGSMSSTTVDFNRIAFEASLLYDEGGKEVDYVKSKPVEFKSSCSEDGRTLDCELRIKVLTSHHEDLLFKVKIQGFHPVTKEEIPNLYLMTFPIKVISKPEQLKKRAPSKKRSLTDMLVETVTRIEKRQEDQQKIIEKVLTAQKNTPTLATLPQSTTSFAPNPSNSNSNPHVNPNVAPSTFASFSPLGANLNSNNFNAAASYSISNRDDELAFWETFLPTGSTTSQDAQDVASVFERNDGKTESHPPVEFEEAFGQLVKAYNTLSSEEKPEKIRKLIRNSSSRDTERLSELLDLFWTDGLLKEHSGFSSRTMGPGTTVHSGSGNSGQANAECQCQDCPHKIELERVDQFYKELLTTGMNLPGF